MRKIVPTLMFLVFIAPTLVFVLKAAKHLPPMGALAPIATALGDVGKALFQEPGERQSQQANKY